MTTVVYNHMAEINDPAASKVSEQGVVFVRTRSYGAELSNRQFGLLVAAIALGTLLEWYDFFAYSQLNAYLTKVFFPAGNPAVTQLSFWGVYAVGFISRPMGALLFGHLADTRGRRICLLVSVTVMAVCTVLISCLPTFAQAGIAAPILLALLRAIQGLAMGGQFGCAMVYLHEIAPAKAKGLVGSIGVASAMVGCMLGVLVVVIVEAIFGPGQMLLFGWRLVFALSIISAGLAFVLRLHMPEPEEFTVEREEIIFQNLQRIAASRPASISVRRSSMSAIPSSSARYNAVQGAGAEEIKEQQQQEEGLLCHQDSVLSDGTAGSDDAAQIDQDCSSAGKEKTAGDTGSFKTGLGLKTIDSLAVTRQQQQQRKQPGAAAFVASTSGGDAVVTIAGTGGKPREVKVPEKQGEYVPALRLLRKHWGGVLLQFLFEAWVSIGFWIISTWLPLQLRKAPVFMPENISQAMLIVNLSVMGAVQLAAGWASDKGMPRVWSCFAVFTAAAGISVPVSIGFARCGVAGCWLLHLLLMVLMGWVLGGVPATCSSIYPATVRSSGFNLAHNMAMSWLGGVSPIIVTALVAVTGSTMMAPGLLLLAAAVISMAAALALLKYAPASNTSLPATTLCAYGSHSHAR
uniref:Major facilitator superfamily (MFS) profile domain-containing protein n=1 Tax=Tetradesmus obliquus TaxID=3088 RepID=A0A383VPF9_TETOB|eukprot:jgi/Sobl393_1/12386/SZX66632.1